MNRNNAFLCVVVVAFCSCNNVKPITATISTTPLNIKRTTTVGNQYLDAAAIKGSTIAEFNKDDISTGVLGYVKSNGSNSPGYGHVIGVLGIAEDNPENLHFLIGVEGRVNGSSINNAEATQIGTLGLSTFVGSHFDKKLYQRYSIGVAGRSEIRNTDDKTPLNEGIAINFYAPSPVGGAYKYSFVGDEQGWFKGASSLQLGQNGVNTGTIQFSSATSGNITIKPEQGALGTAKLTLPALTGRLVVSGSVPANATSAGEDGEVAFDAKYFYWRSGGKWNRIAKDASF